MDNPAPRPKDNSVDPKGEFSLDVPEQIFYLLFQICRNRDDIFDGELAPAGLTLARWRTLAIIRRVQPCSMKDLSRYTTVERTTLTRSVDQLVEQGFVTRHALAKDRRLVLLALTAEGEALYMLALDSLMSFDRRTLAGVPPDAQRSLARTLEQILASLVPDPAEAEAVIRFGRTAPA